MQKMGSKAIANINALPTSDHERWAASAIMKR